MMNQKSTLKSLHYWISLAFFTFIFMAISACEFGPPNNSRPAQAERGKVIFMNQCVSCHGLNEVRATVTDLEKMAPDLTTISKRRHTRDFPLVEVARYIDGRSYIKDHGDREMPVWGEVYAEEGLGEEEIRGRKGELVAFLMTIQVQ